MNQDTFYTSQNLWDLTRVNPDFPFNILMKIMKDSSVMEVSSVPINTAPITWWYFKDIPLSTVEPIITRDNFIGILSAKEAKRMTSNLSLFKKRFDEDFNKRNKILFGE